MWWRAWAFERVVVDGGSWSPGGGPEVVVEDVEDRPVQGLGESPADLGLLAAAPVDPLVADVPVLLADRHGEVEQRAVVVTEADAVLLLHRAHLGLIEAGLQLHPASRSSVTDC